MKKDIYIDADHMIYFISMANINKVGTEFDVVDEGMGTDYKIPMKRYKKQFKELIKEYKKVVEVESIAYDWTPGKTHVIFSDPKTNFRYKLYSKYKSGRAPDKPELFYRLRKWAHKKYGYIKNLEADDVVAHYARKGQVVITTDKDVFRGVPGLFYNSHHFHQCWIRTTKEEAHHFNLIQTIMGDSTDTIPGVPGVGKDRAADFLYEDTWEAVVNAFKGIPPHTGKPFYNADGNLSALVKKIQALNLTEEDAILNHRLISMNQWTPKGGLQLWHPSKN